MKVSDATRLKELETQNARLKKLIANQALDIDMLKEISAETSNPETQTQRRAGAARPVRSWITSPCNTGRPITCASTTAPSSSPKPCTIGADLPVPVHFSSTPGRRGRTPGSKPSATFHQPSTRPPRRAPHTPRASQPRPSQQTRNKTWGSSVPLTQRTSNRASSTGVAHWIVWVITVRGSKCPTTCRTRSPRLQFPPGPSGAIGCSRASLCLFARRRSAPCSRRAWWRCP